MLDFAKVQWTFANASKGEGSLERYFGQFMEAYGYEYDKSKSFGGIIAYDQKNAVALSVDFFTGTPVVGNTNLDSFTRPQGEHFVMTSIRVLSGNNANVNESPWVPGVTIAQHLNGFYTFINNGITQLQSIPFTAHTSAVENPFSGFYELPFLKIWGGQEKIKFQSEFFSLPAIENNLRIEIHGLGLLS